MYIKKYNRISYLIKPIIFIGILFLRNYFYNIKFFFLYVSSEFEMRKIEYYLAICNKIEQQQKNTNFHTYIKPIISIISPIFNREKYILRFIKNIQNQNFNNIELILIDDNSIDNSVKKIELYKKDDKRIKLIRNKKNKGTLISRNLGVLYSKGKYVIIPDPDDIISKNIINICYKYAEKYKYEIIRFNVYIGNRRLSYEQLYKKLKKKPIYQPELKSYLHYGKGELERIDGYIHNKFIKRDAFIRALKLLNNFFLNIYMIYQEDIIMIFSLYITAKSFFFLKEIGYFYIKNAKSITNNLIYDLELKAMLIQLKFVFNYYKNSKYERDIINPILNILKRNDKIRSHFFINDLIIFYDILNIYLNCTFITNENKKIFISLKKHIDKKLKKTK